MLQSVFSTIIKICIKKMSNYLSCLSFNGFNVSQGSNEQPSDWKSDTLLYILSQSIMTNLTDLHFEEEIFHRL